ncbi:Hypothetical protein TPAS_700 [Trichococcus pasteurii]|jgi:hypothetical protein|uniref:Uncharacterized protein n=1 Tax=Trichococcus pasteurii TaxID=43064 RepID=A0A1W1IDF1_9LACT|nr:hypothetical protein SAMN04488086_12818 [Trichococcus pasteurii]SLM51025.1 Hypothetical protein TPAS_700 [Trichococcus pasteurii]SSB91906.1 Hypothetical protein TPAS_700 [Trichococcus pasteurii]
MKIMENIYMFELMKIELYFAIRCREQDNRILLKNVIEFFVKC